jgi:two-component system chemotaxis response regulator CheB
MGRDGADALLEMRRAGATTVAEDAATAVVDGMPRAARDLGAAAEVKRIDEVAEAILAATSAQGTAPRASAR